MKKWIAQIFSLLLIPLLVISTSGTVIFHHYCQAQDANYYGIIGLVSQDHCCAPVDNNSDHASGQQIQPDENCCSHQSILLKTEVYPDSHPKIITKAFQTHSAIPLSTVEKLLSDKPQTHTPICYFTPPPISKHQSVLCIFRL